MPRIEDYFKFPDLITLGETVAISGAGYHEGDRVELSIEFSDESIRHLGEVPLERGVFRWDGKITETAPSGPVRATALVLDGTDTVWGATRSATVAPK